MEQNGWMAIFEEYLTIEDEYPFSVTGIEGESHRWYCNYVCDGVPFVMEDQIGQRLDSKICSFRRIMHSWKGMVLV